MASLAARLFGSVRTAKTSAILTKPVKRPLGPFFTFLAQRRAELKTTNPDLPAKDLVAKVAAEWRTLPAGEKEKFLQQVQVTKTAFDKEVSANSLKLPNGPRTKVSIYLAENLADFQAANPGKAQKEIFAAAIAKYRTLSPAQQQVYADKAVLDRHRYEKELEALKKTLSKTARASLEAFLDSKGKRGPLPQGMYTRFLEQADEDQAKEMGINLAHPPKFADLTDKQKQIFQAQSDHLRGELKSAKSKFAKSLGIVKT